jgi:hypothetical protein
MASNLHDASSSGFMDGAPLAASQIYHLDSESLIAEAVSTALLTGNRSLQAALKDNERWKPYADKITIEWDGQEFAYMLDGTPEEVAAMKAIEYGTPGSPPAPILRQHAFQLGDSTSKAVGEAVNEVVALG